MKWVKGKLLKKLKSIKPIGHLKQDRILQVKASDGYVDFLTKIPTSNLYHPFASRENEPQKVVQTQKMQEEAEVIDVSELMRDLEEEEEKDVEQAVKEHLRMTEEQRKNRIEAELIENSIIIEEEEEEEEEDGNPLLLFEEECPPGGDGCVIFYTTTLSGIRQTFEHFNKIRFLLESFKVVYFERDISMHTEFRAMEHIG